MSVIRWPEPFNEKGRLGEGEPAEQRARVHWQTILLLRADVTVVFVLNKQQEIYFR
ncbi:hypothetical protein [Burkholderia multivorans]|uniref:hypothetical protein n=1 Tax=Burkholderia multivorans TaxID=87883 RepID=UPI001686E153|nr:hypothetical protein [Burkholderia multivorans]MBH9664829.1 hypothetical protein [Burkholderia multivorans]MBU9245191.1 hypothetical protein [Burkholderia multivorans]MBU9651932.1 hypothetical protein [Burkholderia multivorans]MCA8259672.1 hypothetical protein [Burkholderia multivorans]MDN7881486.1 hypothetical protein [Burkholderia multivorans]